jgi:multidrug efflux system membrane fusion protein
MPASLTREELIMRATRHFSSLFVLGLGAVALGCNRETPVAETPPLEVVVAQPVSEKITDWDTYTGTVDAREYVEVKSRVRGYIKDVRFKEGEEIAAGTELFVIDSDPFEADLKQAKGLLTNWEAKLKFADEQLAIYKPLVEKGSVSTVEINKVTANKAEALGGVDTARGKILEAELNIGYCKITAPITGKVGEAVVTKGNLVGSGGAESLLTTIVGVDPMYVNFYVTQRAYQGYRDLLLKRAAKDSSAKSDKLVIPVELSITPGDGFPFKGVIDFVDNKVDPATSSIKVRAKFENPKGPDGRRPLTAGLFARVRVTLAEARPALLIADRAILSDQNLKYVLVVNKEKKVERVDVVVANRVQEDGLREVVAGLKGDEWIIVEGVNRAKPGASVAPTEGKMPRRPAIATK